MHMPVVLVALVLTFVAFIDADLSSSIPMPCGVNIHFTKSPVGEVQELAAAGWKRVRMDFFWAAIETSKGVYDFSDYDALVNSLTPYSITPLFILDYANPLYDNGLSPHSETARAAFSKFASTAVLRYQGRGILWEMWNEPDLSYSWTPEPDPTNYGLLALAVGRAIKSAAPNEIYIGPGLSGFNYTYLDVIFQMGVLEVFDYVSIHGYWDAAPEDWIRNHAILSSVIRKYQPSGKNISIICSEWGQADTQHGFNMQVQSYWLVRQYLATLSTKTPVSIWYDWHDDGTDPNNIQDHFGTVLNPYRSGQNPVYERKPSYDAAQTFMSVLAGTSYVETVVSSQKNYVMEFSSGSSAKPVFVAWTSSSNNRTVAFNAPSRLGQNECFKVVDIGGAITGTLCAKGRVVSVDVSKFPQYLVSL